MTAVVVAGGMWVRESFGTPPVLKRGEGPLRRPPVRAPALAGHTGFFVVGGVSPTKHCGPSEATAAR